jgi:hypothetical protein
MVITEELSRAAVEVNALLDNVSDEVLKRIPNQFIQYLKEIESYDYYFEYDPLKTLEQQGFSDEALKIIGLIYKDYLCNDTEKREYINFLQEYSFNQEEEKRKKYNPENIFKSRQEKLDKSTALIEYKETIFTKIINKIKMFVNKFNKHKT